jgi:hypothetical protein
MLNTEPPSVPIQQEFGSARAQNTAGSGGEITVRGNDKDRVIAIVTSTSKLAKSARPPFYGHPTRDKPVFPSRPSPPTRRPWGGGQSATGKMRWVAESRAEGPRFTLAPSAPAFIRSEEGDSGPCLSSVRDPCSPYRGAPSNKLLAGCRHCASRGALLFATGTSLTQNRRLSSRSGKPS